MTNTPKVNGEAGIRGGAVWPVTGDLPAPAARTQAASTTANRRIMLVTRKKRSGATLFLLLSKIEAHQGVLVAKVDETVGDGRQGAQRPSKNLRLGEGTERVGR